jgi:predicted dehydrogenase
VRVGLIERLAAAGKHVLMEKPVERTTAAAVRIVETMERAGLRLGIVFQHRFRQASERLRAFVEGGELGGLAAAHVVLPWWRPQSYYDEPGRGTLARDGGGVLLSQAIHTLDLALSLTGPASEVAAVAGTTRVHRMETEDFVGAGLRFANGALGALMATTAQYPGFPERIELVGTEATAVLAGGDLSLVHRDGRTDRFGEDQGTGGGADPMDFPHDAHRGVLTDFLDALDEGRDPRVSGREALRVHRFIDALLRSSAEGRAVRVEGEEGTR